MTVIDQSQGQPAIVVRPDSRTGIVLVCEHASHHIPDDLNGLGLAPDVRQSHVAWDPGAAAVAETMSDLLGAALVASGVSRLVYDCNRPPEADAAMPSRSEIFDIPGNLDLDAEHRAARVSHYYAPFRDALARTIRDTQARVLITIHSFTPVYFGAPRSVEIGILHDSDSRLADRMLASAADHTVRTVRRNEPYGPADGVTHTLREHGLKNGLLNVMIEIRNDLIADSASQAKMARMLSDWTQAALASLPATVAQA